MLKLQWSAGAQKFYRDALYTIEELLFLGSEFADDVFYHKDTYLKTYNIFEKKLERMQREIFLNAESYVWKYDKARVGIFAALDEANLFGIHKDPYFPELLEKCGVRWVNFVMNKVADNARSAIFIRLIKKRYSAALSKFEREFFQMSGTEPRSEETYALLERIEEAGDDNEDALEALKQYINLLESHIYFNEVVVSKDEETLIQMNEKLIGLIVQKSTSGVPMACTKVESLFEAPPCAFFEGIPLSENTSVYFLARVLLFPKDMTEEDVYSRSQGLRITSMNEQTGSMWFTTVSGGVDLIVSYPDGNLMTVYNTPFALRKLLGGQAYETIRHNLLQTLALYTLSEEVIKADLSDVFVVPEKLPRNECPRDSINTASKNQSTQELISIKYVPAHKSSSVNNSEPVEGKYLDGERRSYTFTIPYYKRPLPLGHKPSEHALFLAKKHNIDLGYELYFADGRRMESEELYSLAETTGMSVTDLELYFELEGGVKHLRTFVEIEKSFDDHQKLQVVKTMTTVQRL